MVDKPKIVKKNSAAFGYNYASLEDIVKQGFTLPIMETKCIDGIVFMGWLDEQWNWHQGAEVVVPELKGNNAAQAMGAALAYARRYTAYMALGLACDDDKKIETKDGEKQSMKVYGNRIDFKAVRERIAEISSETELVKYWSELKLSEKQKEILKKDFAKRREEVGGTNGLE